MVVPAVRVQSGDVAGSKRGEETSGGVAFWPTIEPRVTPGEMKKCHAHIELWNPIVWHQPCQTDRGVKVTI